MQFAIKPFSQAEHPGLFLEAANDTKFIGSPTQGANVSNLSVRYLQKAVDLDPDNADYRRGLGDAFIQKGNYT